MRPAFISSLLTRMALLHGFALGLAGCSVDMFSDKPTDPSIQGRELYQKNRPECSGLRIEKSELDPKTFRAIIRCFNANGSIPEVAKLVAEASESSLTETLNVLNSALLSDRVGLTQSRTVVRNLKREKQWERIIGQFKSALNDPERLRALIRLLSVGGSQSSLISTTIQRFEPTEMAAAFEMVARVSGSPAYRSLREKVLANPLSPAERDRLTQLLFQVFRKETKFHSGSKVLEALSEGKSSSLWTYVFGSDPASAPSVLEQTSGFYALLKDFGAKGGQRLRELSLFHQGFHHSVSCWGSGKVFDEPWKNLSAELGSHATPDRMLPFVARFAPVTGLGVGAICEIPQQFTQYYPTTLELISGRSGGVYLGVLERIFASGFGYSAGYFVGEWGESLAEVLSLIQEKPWFADLVLVIAQLDSEDREHLATWTRALLLDQSKWGAQVQQWSKADLDQFFSDIGFVLSADSDSLQSWLNGIQELFSVTQTHPWVEGWKRIATHSQKVGVSELIASDAFPESVRALSKMADDGRLAAMVADLFEILTGNAKDPAETAIRGNEVIVRKSPRHLLVGSDLKERETRLVLGDSLSACASLDLSKTPRMQWDLYEKCSQASGVTADSFTALFQTKDWQQNGHSESLLDSLIRSFGSLSLSVKDRQEIIAQLSGLRKGFPKLKPEDALQTLTRVREFLSGSFHETFVQLSSLFRSVPIRFSDWKEFFNRLQVVLLDADFAPGTQALVSLKTTEVSAPAPSLLPDLGVLTTHVRNVECEGGQAAVVRAREVSEAFSKPKKWDPVELTKGSQALVKTLHNPKLRTNFYAWVSKLNSTTTARWLIDRSQDPRAVALIDLESKALKVRWMTTIDRLESILVNSNFTYLLPGNYGLKFIEEFAESWGDEPRANWPREIQEKYSGRKRPPTLRETYEDVKGFLRTFERMGGMPSLPDCAQGPLVPELGRSIPDFLVSAEVKAKVFNLKQTLSVVEENLPGSGNRNAGGMRLLRDFFWAVNSSVPESDRDPSEPDSNPLTSLQAIGELGLLRELSLGLQTLNPIEDFAGLKDLLKGASALVSEPALDRIIQRVIESPTATTRWIRSTFSGSFQFSTLSSRIFTGLALDSTLGLASPLLRYVDSVIGNGLPELLIEDLIQLLGSFPQAESGLITYQPISVETKKGIVQFRNLFETKGVLAFRALPVAQLLNRLDRDPLLRKGVMNALASEFGREASVRQSNGEKTQSQSPLLKLLLGTESPEIRRMIALWCGKNAAGYVYEFTSRPDEASLILEGLLRSAESDGMKDFLEALLRQLPD